MERDRSEVIEQAERAEVKFVSLQFTDVMGTIKNVTIPISELGVSLRRGRVV